jgi:hypothetical protein
MLLEGHCSCGFTIFVFVKLEREGALYVLVVFMLVEIFKF